MKKIELPNLLWYGNQEIELHFPDRWHVELLQPLGFEKPAMDPAGMSKAFANPIGSSPLPELARAAREVVITFDDMTRPTPVREILPYVMTSLEEAGIPDANIRFIPALGTHGAMNNVDFRKKLGDGIIERYATYNHNPYENCDYLGNSPSGVPVFINKEFMSCDLKIGIGCITPHVHAGFGGGGKIILPGLSGVETIKAFHRDVMLRDVNSIGLGKSDGNVMAAEIRDVVRMSGLHFKIDALLNRKGEITDLFMGDPIEEHRVGLEAAKEHYGTIPSYDNDIVIVNAYAKYNEMGICLVMALSGINLSRGTIVMLVDSPEGQVCHYLLRSFGKDYGGELYLERGAPPEGIRVVVCSRFPDMTMCDLFARADSVTITRNWEETLALLEEEYPNEASVAVIPDGTMQYFRS